MSAVLSPPVLTLEDRYRLALIALQVIERGERLGRKMARPELRALASSTLRIIDAPVKGAKCPS